LALPLRRGALWAREYTRSSVLTVEQIRGNYEAGLAQAKRYFMGDADVQRAAKRIAATLSGKPKPVCFPDPAAVAIDLGGAATITLPKLIELKLASGMTAPDRPRDLDDVIQLVRANALPRDFGASLDPWVCGKFDELWGYAQIPAD
jgi:hypothetical protein